MMVFRHNSRQLSFRTPQGAVRYGERVRIEGEFSGDAQTAIFLRLWIDGAETLLPMAHENGRVRAEFTAPESSCLVWYFFVFHTPSGQTLYYGAESGEGMFVTHEPQAYQITVYDPAFTTPRWFCEGVAYQIFPDRFRRSSWEDFRGRAQYHANLGRFLRLHDRWSDEPCTEPSPGQAVYAPDDFFGGDLNGIREKLPYLAALGVTALYLNPVFESSSNHRYNTADYRRIDPILGNEAEFSALCAEARAQGIRLMLDGVFSHTGSDSVYFNQDGRYPEPGACQSEQSPYFPWYRFSRYPDVYECWWNFPSLPNVEELDPSYSAFIHGETGVLSHWAGMGATSWRLDVADELPDEFIKNLRRRVKQNDPDGVLLGEVWEDCSVKTGPDGRRRDFVGGNELDGAMNYPFTDAVIAFLLGKTDAHGLYHTLATQRERYPKPFYEACLNLLSSHDVVRASTALSGAPDRKSIPREQQAAYAPTPENARLGRQRLILATAIQMVLPGVPCIYYGDEAGMTGMADPFNRAPYPWGNEDAELLETFKKLTGARQKNVELRRGLCRMGALLPDVFCIVRYTADPTELSVLLVNRGEREQTVPLDPKLLNEGPDAAVPVPLSGMLTDVLTGETCVCTGDALTVALPPLCARLYTR